MKNDPGKKRSVSLLLYFTNSLKCNQTEFQMTNQGEWLISKTEGIVLLLVLLQVPKSFAFISSYATGWNLDKVECDFVFNTDRRTLNWKLCRSHAGRIQQAIWWFASWNNWSKWLERISRWIFPASWKWTDQLYSIGLGTTPEKTDANCWSHPPTLGSRNQRVMENTMQNGLCPYSEL